MKDVNMEIKKLEEGRYLITSAYCSYEVKIIDGTEFAMDRFPKYWFYFINKKIVITAKASGNSKKYSKKTSLYSKSGYTTLRITTLELAMSKIYKKIGKKYE
jgi:hypothetical protein